MKPSRKHFAWTQSEVGHLSVRSEGVQTITKKIPYVYYCVGSFGLAPKEIAPLKSARRTESDEISPSFGSSRGRPD